MTTENYGAYRGTVEDFGQSELIQAGKCNVDNRTIFCKDNIDILQGINSDCIDLIYLDPPFNKNKNFTAPIGSSAEGAGFKDIFREDDLKEEWLSTIEQDQPELFHYLNGIRGVGNHYNFAYLAYMAIRLIECHRILKSKGRIYLHCDPTMSHYLKLAMDCIFGEHKFQTVITWKRTFAHGDKVFANVSDNILFYGEPCELKDEIYVPLSAEYVENHFKDVDERGRYQLITLTGAGKSLGESGTSWRGIDPTNSNRHWSPPKTGRVARWIENNYIPEYRQIKGVHDRLEKLDELGFIYWPKKGKGVPRLKRYLMERDGQVPTNIWTDIPPVSKSAVENADYPTQKPLALLKRIIEANSNKGDIVLDPFCGCATACVASEQLDRKWIGIDVSVKAYELVKKRLDVEVVRPDEFWQKEVHMNTDPPKRTDRGVDHKETKFVYVISHPNYPGEYKVGIAKNWKSRLNAYQTSDPGRKYKTEFKLETPWFKETERFIHEIFENRHEWVSGDLKDIIHEIKNFKPIGSLKTTQTKIDF